MTFLLLLKMNLVDNMNRKVIQKIIDELNQTTPRIPYVLGILETLIESLPEDRIVAPPIAYIFDKSLPLSSVTGTMDEATRLAAETAAKMSHIDRGAIKTEN